MFMYGEQNSSLSYLTKLGANGVELAEIPHSTHWPVYPTRLRCGKRIALFHGRSTLD